MGLWGAVVGPWGAAEGRGTALAGMGKLGRAGAWAAACKSWFAALPLQRCCCLLRLGSTSSLLPPTPAPVCAARRKASPINHGPCAGEELLEAAARVVREKFVERADSIQFSLIALAAAQGGS